MTDVDAIHQLLSRYCHALDDQRPDALGQLVHDDVRFELPDVTYHGRQAMLERVRSNQRPPGKHLTANIAIEVDGLAASAESDWFWFDHSLRLASAGRYSDEFRCDEGRWRFAVRRISLYISPDEP